MTPLEHADYLADQFYHHVFEDGTDGADHIEPIRQALAASQPPSGDAPDLREALNRMVRTSEGVQWKVGGENEGTGYAFLDAVINARNALAASAPSSPATPAPLDVERLESALDTVEDAVRASGVILGVDTKMADYAPAIARAYAEQEGGDCQHGIPRNECKLAEHDR